MNEIEYAITNLEEFLEADIGQGDLHMCSAETALTALREKAEREKGCKYCNSDMCFTCIKQLDYYGDGSFESKCADEADAIRCVAYKPMKYCPMCGKRLEEHNEAD
jgi:hypothetical protein